jgi:hypothetical protein
VKSFSKGKLAHVLRRRLNRDLRPYWIEPMREPAAPDVTVEFEVDASEYCFEEAKHVEFQAEMFVKQVRREFKDRVADVRVSVATIPDTAWAERKGLSPGDYFVTLTASLTTLRNGCAALSAPRKPTLRPCSCANSECFEPAKQQR